jgi:CheY-like chemotaxis protein
VRQAGNPPELAARAVLTGGCERTMEMDDKSYHVLLGDAEAENAELFERALLCCPAFTLTRRASSIAELISHLAGDGNFVGRPDFCGPDLVLLDLDLSGTGSGFEALEWIQSQPTRLFRVVVFSSTAEEQDCARAYSLGADGFVTKPRSVPEMITVLTRIEGWLKNSAIESPDDFCAA